MSNYVNVSVLSYAPPPGDPAEDPQKVVHRQIAYWQEAFAKVLPDKPDLIVVPEACDEPSDRKPEQLEAFYRARGDQVLESFAKTAKANRCYVTYPAMRQLADGTRRNSTVLLDRSGNVAGIYNKNHLVICENTEMKRLYGKSPTVIECDFGRVGFAICFDLNFDALRLQYVSLKPDLILFSSMYHGGLMQNYWAYSCRCHFIGAIWRGYPCAILDPTGAVIASTTKFYDFVTAKINLDCLMVHLDENREKLDALKAKYGPKVRVHDTGELGSLLVSSETDELTARDMVKEFKVELLDHYFERSLAHRREPGRIEP